MHRLSPRERVTVVALLAAWAVLFGLSIQAQVQDIGVSPLFIAPGGPQGYPSFEGVRPPVTPGDSGLVPGDVLLKLGARDVRGAGRMDVLAWVPDQSHGLHELPVVYERDGVRHEGMLPLESHRIFWPILPLSFSLAFAAFIGALRIRPTRLTRLGFLGLALGAIELASFCLTSESVVRIAHPIRIAASSLSIPFILMAAQRFPDGREPRNALWRWLPWVFVLRGLIVWSVALGVPLPPSLSIPAIGIAGFAFLAAGVAVLVYKYAKSDAIGRRQMRWVVFGLLVASVPASIAFPMTVYDPQNIPWAFAAISAYAIVPFCLLLAINRYNLFDVDRLLTATASYNLILLAIVGGLLLVVPTAAVAASEAIGTDASMTQTVLSILLVAAVVPLQRPLRAGIEQLFFREHVQTDEAFAELARGLAGCADARALLTRLGEGLELVLRPTACAIYAPDGAALSPVYTHGAALPAAIERDGPLFGTLTRNSSPLALGVSRIEPGGARLGPFERAALESLAAEAVLPLLRAGELVAVVCLGEKRTGDVYTRTDLSWLRALGDRVTVELDRFDQRRILDESRAMQEQLRRYVPGAVADELKEGRELESRECEVSVLFVDIRGYSSFSEGRGAAEIFSTVNAYTEKMSQLVRECGGAVVEFNGDGMMAVFGAPRELPDKEEAAVRAGIAMLSAIASLPISEGQAGLRVGVGVATGSAFVGNIRAADRFIWTAIGNTTNLAARLQALTRERDVGIIIDEPTFARLRSERGGFRPIGPTAIRGRTTALRLYTRTA